MQIQKLNVSEVTIRNDLRRLEQKNAEIKKQQKMKNIIG
jgi:DeoR/GlpR family transcriptional regulator of sugar metabolism